MLTGPQLRAVSSRARIESAMSPEVLSFWVIQRFPEIAGLLGCGRFIGLLSRIAHAGQNAVQEAGHYFIQFDSFGGGQAHQQFTSVMMRRPVNGFGSDLWLINGGNRLRFMWQTALHPRKLRSVDGGEMHHRHMPQIGSAA